MFESAVSVALTALPTLALIIIAVILSYGFWKAIEADGNVLKSLTHPEYARGLITLLFSLATVGVAIACLFFVSGTFDESSKVKFSLAKEILTVLIGVFGTILGFYFGTDTEIDRVGGLTIAAPAVGSPTPDGTPLTTFVSGGQAPYTYLFVFAPSDAIEGTVGGESKDGLIQQTIKLSVKNPPQQPVSYKIVVTDARGAVSTLDSVPEGSKINPKAGQ